MPNVVVFSPYRETHACAYIRIVSPMRAAGWDVTWARSHDSKSQRFDVGAARRADVVLVQRQFPALRHEDVFRSLLRLGVPIVYDLDDMLLGVPQSHPSHTELSRRAPFMRWALKEADLVTVSTPALKQLLGEETTRPIAVLPNLIDWPLFCAEPRSCTQEFRFLVAGTSTHRRDWAILEKPLERILAEYPRVARVIFFGEVPARFVGHPQVSEVNSEEDYRRYASRLRALEAHAALVPLEDTQFNRCKSNIKWLEYSAAGIPGAYSDVDPYRSCIENGRSGLLVANTEDAWYSAMEFLLSRRSESREMWEVSRQRVLEQYLIERASESHAATFAALLRERHRRRLFAGCSTLGARLRERIRQDLAWSNFYTRYVRWRALRR